MDRITELFVKEKEAIARVLLVAQNGKPAFVEAVLSVMAIYFEILEIDCANQDALLRCFRASKMVSQSGFTERQTAAIKSVNEYYKSMCSSGDKEKQTLAMLSLCRLTQIINGATAWERICQLANSVAQDAGCDRSSRAQAWVIMAVAMSGQRRLDAAKQCYQMALEMDPVCVDALYSLGLLACIPQMTAKAFELDPTHIEGILLPPR